MRETPAVAKRIPHLRVARTPECVPWLKDRCRTGGNRPLVGLIAVRHFEDDQRVPIVLEHEALRLRRMQALAAHDAEAARARMQDHFRNGLEAAA